MKSSDVRMASISLLLGLLIVSFALKSETGTPARAMRWAYLTDLSPVILPGSRDHKGALEGYGVAALAGFAVDRNGKLAKRPALSADFASAAIRSGTGFIPLVTFISPADGAALLSSPPARSRAVKEIIECVRALGACGVHIDFEYLPAERSKDLAVFTGELRQALKASNSRLSLSMALFPHIGFPRKWAGFHDFALLAPLLDEAVLMCYDQHRRGTPPGPVVSVSWAEENIKHALKFFSPQKLWLGVPGYGYAWRGASVEVVSSRTGVLQAARHGGRRHDSGCLYYEYRRGDEVVQVYVSDVETRRELEALARKNGLRGTALWRLGLEDAPGERKG